MGNRFASEIGRYSKRSSSLLSIVFLGLFAILMGTVNQLDGAAPDRPNVERPNVVFLFADDMRADSINALGNRSVITPNLDKLVRRGLVFRNAYCFGGNIGAVCTPSRNMLLSGNCYFRWRDFKAPNNRQGILAPGDGPNFPLSMKDAGYFTYHHGKRGNTATLIQARFDVNKYLADDQKERLSGEPGKEIVDDAITFLRDRNSDGSPARDKPFFMYLAFGNPHDPRVAAKTYLDQYKPSELPLPKNFLPIHPFDNGDMSVRDEKLLPWPRTVEDIQKTLHEYYATVTGLDFHIGRLIASLEEMGALENTIIVFSADQGISIGSHGLLGKQNLYDAAMKAPLVFAGPGISQGTNDSLVYLFDIYPTVCDLVHAKVPVGIDGQSMRPLLAGDTTTTRTELLLSYQNVQRAVRVPDWKLIRYPQADVTQLFDMKNDPDEITNVAGDPRNTERVRDLMTRLQTLQAKYGDELKVVK